jgi:hypothetical protein
VFETLAKLDDDDGWVTTSPPEGKRHVTHVQP